MTRVLVDLLFMTGRRGGMETYARRLYSAMGRLPSAVEWVGLASAELAASGAPWFPGELLDSGVRSVSSARWALGELRDVARTARGIGADAVHCPANIGPRRAGAPTVVTVHDLLPFVRPEWAGGRASATALRALVRGAVRGATTVITVSEASADDIRRRLAPRAPVRVIPLAGDPDRVGADAPRASDLLFVPGNRMPHKDQQTVLAAVAALPAGRRPRVLVTGSRPGDPLRPLVTALGLEGVVDLVPWLDEHELARAYATATAVVLPTRFEGFGLPVLEAMAAGCPVICSDLPVLREVGGDAALYARPGSPDDFASAIRSVVDDPRTAARMSGAGLARAAAFDWTTTARSTLDVLTSAARTP